MGVACYTSDWGKTWTLQRGAETHLFAVKIVDGKGLAVGDTASIYATKDAGKTWTKIEPPLNIRHIWFQGLARLSENRYLIAGADGAVLFIEHSKIVSGRP